MPVWSITNMSIVDPVRKKVDIKAENVAMFEDRILVSTGKKQMYGTQLYYMEDDGVQKRVLSPIEDVEHVDELRHSVGLPPLKESYSEDELRRSGLLKNM